MAMPLLGRESELGQLRDAFDAAAGAAKGVDGRGPRIVVVLLAESGLGKTRLVQELYLQLASDAVWDPPSHDYWPAVLGDQRDGLRVNPELHCVAD